MVKKYSKELWKRALSLGVMLSLMAVAVIFFNGNVLKINSSLIVMLSTIALSAFVAFLVWPIIKESNRVMDNHNMSKDGISPEMVSRKSMFIKVVKRSSILIIAWLFLVGVEQITNGAKWMVNTSLIIILSGLALIAFIFFLIWPAFYEIEKMFNRDKNDEMFP